MKTLKTMKLTKNVISRKEALKLAPHYVTFSEQFDDLMKAKKRMTSDEYVEHYNKQKAKYDKADKSVMSQFENLKRNQSVLVYNDGRYVICKVSSINHDDFRAIDGPIVRVGNGEYTWRVDGDRYAYPIKAKKYLT